MVDTATLNRFFRWYYETQDVPKSQDGKGGYTGGTNTVQRNLRALFAYLAEEYEHPDPSRIGSGSCAAVQVPAGTVHAAPAISGTIAARRTLRRPAARSTALMAPAAQLANATPCPGPRVSAGAGTATRAESLTGEPLHR